MEVPEVLQLLQLGGGGREEGRGGGGRVRKERGQRGGREGEEGKRAEGGGGKVSIEGTMHPVILSLQEESPRISSTIALFLLSQVGHSLVSLVPRPPPSFLSLAVRKAGEGLVHFLT